MKESSLNLESFAKSLGEKKKWEWSVNIYRMNTGEWRALLGSCFSKKLSDA